MVLVLLCSYMHWKCHSWSQVSFKFLRKGNASLLIGPRCRLYRWLDGVSSELRTDGSRKRATVNFIIGAVIINRRRCLPGDISARIIGLSQSHKPAPPLNFPSMFASSLQMRNLQQKKARLRTHGCYCFLLQQQVNQQAVISPSVCARGVWGGGRQGVSQHCWGSFSR